MPTPIYLAGFADCAFGRTMKPDPRRAHEDYYQGWFTCYHSVGFNGAEIIVKKHATKEATND